jgi:predicted ATP-grasp superfamily ATP-dependent carboligase
LNSDNPIKHSKRILITGAGGAPATNFVRSLRLVKNEKVHFIGVDADKYYLQRAETDEKHLVPLCNDSDYLASLNQIIEQTGAEFLFAQPDMEIAVLSELRGQLKCKVLLPSKETIKICMDKFLSFEKWREAGLTVPETMMIFSEADLKEALEKFGPKIWIRAVTGAAGKGSLPTDNYNQAKAWLDFHDGWGAFSAAACLEQQSITWQSIWNEGELVVAQGRKRIYWEFANRAPSGITGLTGTGVTISDPLLDDLAQKSIHAIDKKPHGIFSVDMTYNREGVPNPTEINIGRFFTTHFFFTKAGLNMPQIYVKLAFGEKLPPIKKKINSLPEGIAWVRGMDIEPVLTDIATINQAAAELKERRSRL